jgi:hypothetical protein
MAAKPIDKDIADLIVREWRTGRYSQNELAFEHKVSKGVINKLCKGIDRDAADIVTAGVVYHQGLNSQDDRMVTVIENVVSMEVRLRGKVERFVEKAIDKGMDMMDKIESGSDYKAVIDGVDKATVTIGINERHAKPTTITNTTQTANFSGMSNDDIKRRLKEIDERVISVQ